MEIVERVSDSALLALKSAEVSFLHEVKQNLRSATSVEVSRDLHWCAVFWRQCEPDFRTFQLNCNDVTMCLTVDIEGKDSQRSAARRAVAGDP